MNRKVKKIAGLVITMFLLTINMGCAQIKRVKASGNYITKEIKVANFDAIKLQGSEDILYSQSTNGKTSIKIYASDNVMDLLNIRVENGTLIVSYKNNINIFGDRSEVKVIVSSPTLNNINILGSGDIFLKTAVRSSKLNISIQGSGDIKGNGLSCKELSTFVQGSGDMELRSIKSEIVNATVQGSGDITLVGESQTISLKTQGSGDISASGLKGQNVTAVSQGSGDITCYATGSLNAQINGSGDISYKGKPSIDFQHNKKLHKLD